MDQFLRDPARDTILLVNSLVPRNVQSFVDSVASLEKILSRKLKVLVVSEKRDKLAVAAELPKDFIRISCNTDSIIQLEKALSPYLDSILAAVCISEKDIPYFKNIIPHIPYVTAPSETSLAWSSDKINMRRRLRAFNTRISPQYTIVEDISTDSIEKIKTQVGFPLIVKPAGLAASALVSVCYHEEELKKVLAMTIKKAATIYKQKGRLTKPRILVEQFMDGNMYTIDVYVNSRGTAYTTPLISVITGYSDGTEDFFGYKQATPVMLKSHKHQAAFSVAKEACEALGLRSITAHVELMRTEDGWKVIEINPRIGGFRSFLYGKVYGIDHALNDLLIRLPMRPIIPRKPKGHGVVMKIYAKSEGQITKIAGLKRITEVKSYMQHDQNLRRGDDAYFARHGGGSVLDMYLFAEKRSDLLADIRRVEQTIEIQVIAGKRAKKDSEQALMAK